MKSEAIELKITSDGIEMCAPCNMVPGVVHRYVLSIEGAREFAAKLQAFAEAAEVIVRRGK